MSDRRRRAFCLLYFAVCISLTGCAARAAQPATASRPPLEQLQRDLAAIFTAPEIDHAQWSVAVASIARGDSLYRLNAQRLQVPASSQKLLTTAVAAERLGWDHRYSTVISATAAIGADGTLDGDLIVSSNGDPTINPRHPERFTVFDAWAQQLADRGLRRVTGRLIGDDNQLAEPGWGLGWSWDDIPLGYGTPVGALQYNESQVELLVRPGAEPGARAAIALSPEHSGLSVDDRVSSVAAGAETRIALERMQGSNQLVVRGQIAMDAKPVTELAAVANPTQQYVNGLAAALARHGITVDGGAVDIDELPDRQTSTARVTLVEDRSPPLADIIGITLKFSRNLYAETLLRSLAVEQRPAPTSEGDTQTTVEGATTEAGLQLLRETLASWGIANDGYLARDGSGLSRYDWLSTDTLTRLLVHMAKQPQHADRFRLAQAIPGEKGTLEMRMVDSPLQSRVWAKTGSMSQVRSIAGYLTTVDGEPLVFAIIVNGFRIPSREIDAVMDHALARLVEFRR